MSAPVLRPPGGGEDSPRFSSALPGGQVVRVQRAAAQESGGLGEGARVRLGFAPGAATLLTR